MRIMILHLSDMHFCGEVSFSEKNIQSIIRALNRSSSGIEHVLVIISGDLAYSGKKKQYDQVKIFLDSLEVSLRNRYAMKQFDFILVPGNHDVDYDKGDWGRDDLEEIFSSKICESFIEEELGKQSEFYIFARQYACFSNDAIVYPKVVKYGSKEVRINLINTAIFSSLDEDQGYHYISSEDIKVLSEQCDSDFVISVMHHPHHWYSSYCKKELEQALYSRSDIIFVGHEHYESSMNIGFLGASVDIFAGGMLCNKGDWRTSEFHVGVLDLDTREYVTSKYIWNDAFKVYEEDEKHSFSLSRNRYNQLNLTVKNDFIVELTEDKYMIAKSNSDYFVFPLLVEEIISEDNNRIPREINSIEDFLCVLRLNRRIIVTGTSDSGKSILASSIYTHLSRTKVTLFVDGCNVSKNIDRTFKSIFEDIYSDVSAYYEIFKQMSREELAVVVDNMDAVPPVLQEEFLEYLTEHFGIIVETCHLDIDVDIKNRLRRRTAYDSFVYYRIEPFYSDKRKLLVSNIVRHCVRDDFGAQERVVFTLCNVLNKLKYLYSWSPDFIVQFAKHYCNNIGDAMYNDGSIFSKVFESNIVQLIKPHVRRITVDKVLMILDKIAYGIYTAREYPMSLAHIDLLIKNYNDAYDSKIDTSDFLNLLLRARIFKKFEDKYFFSDRNYFSYFVAREIRREYLENANDEQLYRTIRYSYSGLNADILLFITYITDNLNIIKAIMSYSDCIVKSWNEFNLLDIGIPFLVSPVEKIIRPYKDSDKIKAEQKQIEQEKREIQTALNANDRLIFEGEDDDLSSMQEILRSISLMVILAKTLPSFEHLMKKEDKKKCVELIYTMPLKIFEKIAGEIDGISSELISDIKNFHEYEFRKDKLKLEPLTDEQALCILKWEVTSILLDLMNAAMGNATRQNTNDFLDQFDYKKVPTYFIEHILGLSRRDDVSRFMYEVEKIFSETRNALTKNLVQRITKNFIVNSRKIKQNEIDRLNSKIFDESLRSDKIVLEQGRNRLRNS